MGNDRASTEVWQAATTSRKAITEATHTKESHKILTRSSNPKGFPHVRCPSSLFRKPNDVRTPLARVTVKQAKEKVRGAFNQSRLIAASVSRQEKRLGS
jgi:hypothetical protein